jgi:hypothetical protein
MTSQDEITRTENRLKDALGAAADIMTVHDSPVLFLPPRARRAGGWLLPLAAAVSVVAIVLATLFVVHVYGNPASQGDTANGTATAPPEFYLTLDSNSDGSLLAVRRTDGGAITATLHTPGTMLQGGYLAADASGRAFYVAGGTQCSTAPTVSRFYRITITDSGKVSGVAKVGSLFQGMVTDLAVSPDGSQIAYTLSPALRCESPVRTGPQDVVRIMDLSTGAIRTWYNTATAASPARVLSVVGGLSWAPGGRTLIVDYVWAAGKPGVLSDHNLAVLGLDTASSGGSLQADSRLLWSQNQSCGTCVREALAGPGDSLTAVEVQSLGQRQTRELVVHIPLQAGQAQTVLYSELSPTPASEDLTAIFADSTGRWVIAWPLADLGSPSWQGVRAGWLSGGVLHRLPGTTWIYPYAIAWLPAVR